MKIAIVTNSFPLLSESFILSQITGLIDLGHEVDIFAFDRPKESFMHADVKTYGLLKRVTYINGVSDNPIKSRIKMALTYMTHFSSASELNRCLIGRKNGARLQGEENFFKLIGFLGRKYDVIHCHFGSIGRQFVFLKEFFPQTKIVVQFHGYDVSLDIQKNPRIYEDLFHKADYFLPVSEYFQKRLIDLGCPKERTFIHYCGVDPRKFPYAEHNFDFKKKVHLLSVARLVEKKGLIYAIEAVAQVIKIYPHLKYTIIGGGKLRGELESLVERLGLSQNVHFTGALTQEETKNYYASADILLVPSVTALNGDQEGMPVVIKEAMSSGTPVVSTTHAGIPEIVQDGITGALVPEKDSKALAEKIEYLLAHPDMCSQMAQAGRKRVEEKFDERTLNEQLQMIYRKQIEVPYA